MNENLLKKYPSPQQWQFWLVRGRINPDTGLVYTEDEAKIHVSSFRKSSKFYWMKRGLSEEDSIKAVSESQKASYKASYDKNKHRKDRFPNQKDYWLSKGYSDAEADQLVSQRQNTFTLEKCIAKYGDEAGRDKYLKRQKDWQNTMKNKKDQSFHIMKSLSLEIFIERGLTIDDYCKMRRDKDGTDLYLTNKTKDYILDNKLEQTSENFNNFYKIFKRNLKKTRGVASKESLKYFIPLYKFCRKIGISRNDIMIGVSGSKEYVISRKIKRIGKRGQNRHFRYDFTILSKKIIIEYNHIDFHPDPDIMGLDKFLKHIIPLSKMSSDEKYKYDNLKTKEAQKEGYSVHVIWSHLDFLEQFDKIKKIINESNS